MKNITKKIIVGAMLVLPIAVLAAPAAGQKQVNISSITEIMGIITSVINWFAAIVGTLAVFFIIMAGWKYLTAGGEQEELNKAKSQLIYAAVGIAITLLAYSVPVVIQNFLQ